MKENRTDIRRGDLSRGGETAAGAVPIGSIIGLHPRSPSPGDDWVACDATSRLGKNFPGFEHESVPDLTDDRFLMGGAGTGVVSGGNTSNEVTLTTNEMPAHDHSGSTGGPTSIAHTHTKSGNQSGTGASGANDGSSGDTFTFSISTISSGSALSTHTHTLSSEGSGQAFDIKPLYFKVKYYIKIS